MSGSVDNQTPRALTFFFGHLKSKVIFCCHGEMELVHITRFCCARICDLALFLYFIC